MQKLIALTLVAVLSLTSTLLCNSALAARNDRSPSGPGMITRLVHVEPRRVDSHPGRTQALRQIGALTAGALILNKVMSSHRGKPTTDRDLTPAGRWAVFLGATALLYGVAGHMKTNSSTKK